MIIYKTGGTKKIIILSKIITNIQGLIFYFKIE